jgi:hypothetical protein
MRLLHDLAMIHATFDVPNLVSRAGLRAAGSLASLAHARARGATLRGTSEAEPRGQAVIPGLTWSSSAGRDQGGK